MSRAITVTSGKGGVGKSNISLNLALQLSRTGHRTCLFDADLGLANINILLGLQPEYDLKDVLLEGRALEEVIIKGPEGIDILPGSSGIQEMADLPPDRVESLLHAFSRMEGYDFLIFDTSAGISKNVVAFCLASDEVVLIITPEPTSLTDAFALLKVLILNGFQGEARVVMNQCKNAEVAKVVYKKFKTAALKFLERDVQALGVVYQDEHVTEAVKKQKPLLSLYPQSGASRCIQKIAERIAQGESGFETAETAGFWSRFLDLFRSPLELPRKKGDPVEEGGPPASSDAGRAAPPGESVEVTVQGPVQETKPSGASETIEASIAVEPVEDSRPPVVPVVDPSYLPLLEKLTEGILSVSKELRLVREAITGNGKGGTAGPEKKSTGEKAIPLDLDAFVKGRLQ